MIIDAPQPEQIASLKALWQEAFGDTEEYLRLFFTTAFSPDRCRCLTESGEVAAALYWFDCAVEGKPYAYLYAIATKKAFRGRGLCNALMANTHRHLQELGYAGAILVAAEESLFDFYRAMGYRNFGGISRFTCPSGQEAASSQAVTPEEYHALRQKLLPPGSAEQDLLTIRFLGAQTALLAGEDFLISCSKEEDVLLVEEYLGDPQKAPAIVKAFGCREGRFRTPGKEPFAMYLPFTENAPTPAYFGICLS